MMTVLPPVVILPLVRVSMPVTVGLILSRVTPLALLMVRFGIVAVSSGPVVCVLLPAYTRMALAP